MKFKEYKINEISNKIFSGGTPSTNINEYWGGSHYWMSSGETKKKFVYETVKTITKKGIDNSSTQLAKKGNIVIASAGQGHTRGQVSICMNDMYINQSLICIDCDSSKVNNFYLLYTLSSEYEKLRSISDGNSIRGSLTTGMIANFPVLLPSLENQNKIAKILSDIDKRIELNNKINNNLHCLSQELYKKWFVDFVGFNINQNKKIPDGWQLKSLDSVCKMSAGGDKPDIMTEVQTECCNIPIYSNGIDQEGLYGFTNIPRIFNKSVTVSARGTIGYTCLRLAPYVPIVRLISLEPDIKQVSAEYLYLTLLNANINGTGTTQQQLTIPNFKNQKIIVPTLDVVRKFNDIIEPMYIKIDANKKENQILSELSAILLPKLLNGEIDLDKI